MEDNILNDKVMQIGASNDIRVGMIIRQFFKHIAIWLVLMILALVPVAIVFVINHPYAHGPFFWPFFGSVGIPSTCVAMGIAAVEKHLNKAIGARMLLIILIVIIGSTLFALLNTELYIAILNYGNRLSYLNKALLVSIFILGAVVYVQDAWRSVRNMRSRNIMQANTPDGEQKDDGKE